MMKKLVFVAIVSVLSFSSCLSFDVQQNYVSGGESWWYNQPVDEAQMVNDVVSNIGASESVVFYNTEGTWRKDATPYGYLAQVEAYDGPKMVANKRIIGSIRTKLAKEPKDLKKLWKTYAFFGFANGLSSSYHDFFSGGTVPALFEKEAAFDVSFTQVAFFQEGPTEMVYVDAIPAGMKVTEVNAVKSFGLAKIAGMTKYEVIEKNGSSYVVVKIRCDKPINQARIVIFLEK